MAKQWWTQEDVKRTTTAMQTAIFRLMGRGIGPTLASPHAAAEAALASLTPTVERIRREAKAEALRELARDLRVAWGDGPAGSRYYGALQHADPPARNVPLKDWLRDRADRIEADQ